MLSGWVVSTLWIFSKFGDLDIDGILIQFSRGLINASNFQAKKQLSEFFGIVSTHHSHQHRFINNFLSCDINIMIFKSYFINFPVVLNKSFEKCDLVCQTNQGRVRLDQFMSTEADK